MISASILIGILINCSSTVAIVILNKYLYQNYDFHYMVFLSACHFIGTALGVRLAHSLGVFEYRKARVKDVLPLVVASCSSVAFMNLNLAHNSVGFYQMSKLMCIPAIVLINYFIYNKTIAKSLLLTLFVMLLGVGLATVSDVQLNLVGSFFALCGVIATTAAQITTNRTLNNLGFDAMQMLMHTAHLIALTMLILSPFFDQWTGPNGLLSFEWSTMVFYLVVGTSTLAVAVNVSNYLVLARTSPITYQVVGHLKTVSILILGFYIFNYELVFKNVLGIIVALIAMMVYSDLKRQHAVKKTTPSYKLVPTADDKI